MTRVFASLPSAAEAPTNRQLGRKTAALVSTSGLLVGFGAVSATPAFAATSADCTGANTVSSGNADDIQTLLYNALLPIVCVEGTFTIDGTLFAPRDVTIFGLTGAVLDSDGTDRVITGDSEDSVHVTLQNLTITDGVTFGGGAVAADAVTVIDSSFRENSAGFGGAIVADTVTVTGSTFELNTANFEGGAIVGYDSVSVTDSTFLTNSTDDGDGGAITSYGSVTVDASTFVGNSASRYGGAIDAYTSEVQNSTFVGNSADDEGGAIFTGDSEVQFSTFLNNTSAVPQVEAELPGESIYLSVIDTDNLSIRGNIFAGSTGYPQLGVGGTVTTGQIFDFAGNVFSTSRATESDLGFVDPSTLFDRTPTQLFGSGAAPGSNGGSTQTVALIAGSPAIDAVPSLAALTSAPASDTLSPAAISDLNVDQRGEPRVANADAGAFELQADEVGGEGAEGPELAATGTTSGTAGLLGGAALLLMGLGAALAFAGRRIARTRP